MAKRKLIQMGNKLYTLRFFKDIETVKKLDEYLDKYDVRILKEK